MLWIGRGERACRFRSTQMSRGVQSLAIATALDAAPEAAAFFDSLAQFYRTAWLRWIDSTKRRPDQRSIRIAELVRELQQGHKERP